MSLAAGATWLVARREFTERIRSRAFQIATAVTVARGRRPWPFLPASSAMTTATTYDVGVQGTEALRHRRGRTCRRAGLRPARRAARAFPARRQRATAVRDESVDAALVRGVIVTLRRAAGRSRAGAPGRAPARCAPARRCARRDVAPAQARRVLNPPPLRTVAARRRGRQRRPGTSPSSPRCVLYMQLIIYGLAVASGVVEEKSTRVVEVLLASIAPRALLAGKIAGIGVFGLLQLTVTAVVGFALAAASGAIELDWGRVGTIAVVLVWFLLGYVLLGRRCTRSAGRSSLARRTCSPRPPCLPSRSSSATCWRSRPSTIPSRALAVISSLVPFSSPIIMPARVALGAASAAEIVASLGLLLVGIAVARSRSARASTRTPCFAWASRSSCARRGGAPRSPDSLAAPVRRGTSARRVCAALIAGARGSRPGSRRAAATRSTRRTACCRGQTTTSSRPAGSRCATR